MTNFFYEKTAFGCPSYARVGKTIPLNGLSEAQVAFGKFCGAKPIVREFSIRLDFRGFSYVYLSNLSYAEMASGHFSPKSCIDT